MERPSLEGLMSRKHDYDSENRIFLLRRHLLLLQPLHLCSQGLDHLPAEVVAEQGALPLDWPLLHDAKII